MCGLIGLRNMPKLYYITIGSFRNMIVESEKSVEDIKGILHQKGYWEYNVSEIYPGKLNDIPNYVDRNKPNA